MLLVRTGKSGVGLLSIMRLFLCFALFLLTSTASWSQSFQSQIEAWAKDYTRRDAYIRPSKVTSCDVDSENEVVSITLDGGFPEQHFTPEVVEDVYAKVRSFLPDNQKKYDLKIYTEDHLIEDLVPNFFRKGHKNESRMLKEKYEGNAWVSNVSRPYRATHGLEGNHIALWQSHGRYFRTEKDDWYWERPRLFCTTEDLFTQTFVLPYVIPMLQNAGAVVFTPRERDWQSNEVIVDNDQPNKNGTYIEASRRSDRKHIWKTSMKNGFAHYKEVYETVDSPFCDGTARYVEATHNRKEESFVQWVPEIPESGKYAVYVAYQSLPNSVDDALYTVYHKGGMTEFKVNQKMGGGIWTYLGTFEFDKGEHDYCMVKLSNVSDSKGVVTADAVRFGGGMGNIIPTHASRSVKPSGLPRWAEAAKYSTVWYGFPYSIHTEPFGTNEYNNDINSRPASVNELSGGSVYNNIRKEGRHVPIDLSIAFHSDAGYHADDSYIGSLAIYRTNIYDGKTGSGMDRYTSRDLTSIMLTNLSVDLKKYNWRVRQTWNRDYGEARTPMAPACILEMLSHQNFGDMKKGFDPTFKFDFCRSVYKSIVKYVSSIYNRNYTIQPLPVDNFAITLDEEKNEAELTWDEVEDPLEPTAKAQDFILYTRMNNEAFDNGKIVHGNTHKMKFLPGVVYSFKVTAVNKGGESFPSETLTAGIAPRSKGKVLIVNGFTRLEGPKTLDTSTEAGFLIDDDPGVPYGAFAGYCGAQKTFNRSRGGSEGAGALGDCGSEYEGKVMMGNTFDYPFIHGYAIYLDGRYSFTSCSAKAVSTGKVKLNDYQIVDLIYGVQKNFDNNINRAISNYRNGGGRLLISGANMTSDEMATVAGTIKDKRQAKVSGCQLEFDIYREMNDKSYSVPEPSVLNAVGGAYPIMTYQNGQAAAVAMDGKFIRMGFPLESITDRKKINMLMGAFITFLEKNAQ